jgi:hypothetical protein
MDKLYILFEYFSLNYKLMKELSLILILSVSALAGKAQPSEEIDFRRNEIKLNLIYGLFEIGELTYERIINNNMGVGFSGAYFFGEDSEIRALALPYFRFYTADDRQAKGFFIEANSGLVVSESEVVTVIAPSGIEVAKEETYYSFGFGVAVGGKFVSQSGLFGEIYGGLGREFKDESSLEIYPRSGLSLGYRF